MHTNINIKDIDHQYSYIIEYNGYVSEIPVEKCTYYPCGLRVHDSDLNIHKIVLRPQGVDWYKNENYWSKITSNGMRDLLPSTIKMARVTLLFPEFSVDTYSRGVKYALSANTWIHGHKISLGTWILSRIDAVASDHAKSFSDQTYHECISVELPDPYYLIYGDEWRSFREEVCGELYIDDTTLNNTGSSIYFSLYPVELSDGNYVMKSGYIGGQNSINIAGEKDYLNLSISTNTSRPLSVFEEPCIDCALDFNELYLNDLGNYLLETYGATECYVKYGLAIGSEDELYVAIESDKLDINTTNYKFTKTHILSTGNFTNGEGYKEGMKIVCSVDIVDSDDESLLYLLSNQIPFTQELFRYFVKGEFEINGYIINNINLNDVDMNVYNINTVNRIEQKVVQLERTNNSKANVVQPVFFRAIESHDIVIRPAVSETISLNLDIYKAKVKTFKLRIGEVDFIELGRSSSGVLFKIVGSKLPKDATNGLYYILNEGGDLVTSGKYIYEG